MKLRVSAGPFTEALPQIRTFVRAVLALIAIVYLGCFGYITTRRTLYQISATQNFERAPQPTHSAPTGPVLLGRITVPRLELTAMVNEGVDEGTLALAVGHIPGTALPGSTGNVAVAAHRDTFFRPLKDLRANDEIDFTTDQGEFRYRVTSMRIVNPDNVEVLRSSSEPELTMITCYPFEFFGHAPKRFVVQARQIPPRSL
jgi:sortase A